MLARQNADSGSLSHVDDDAIAAFQRAAEHNVIHQTTSSLKASHSPSQTVKTKDGLYCRIIRETVTTRGGAIFLYILACRTGRDKNLWIPIRGTVGQWADLSSLFEYQDVETHAFLPWRTKQKNLKNVAAAASRTVQKKHYDSLAKSVEIGDKDQPAKDVSPVPSEPQARGKLRDSSPPIFELPTSATTDKDSFIVVGSVTDDSAVTSVLGSVDN